MKTTDSAKDPSRRTMNARIQPLITAVIPTYNRGRILPRALESVLQQTYRPIEVVVVDDGSTDNTEEVVKRFADEQADGTSFSVRYVHQQNAGANAARNRGIREAKGKYIAFLDSDDRWLPEKLARQVAVLQGDAEVGDVYCGVRHIDLDSGTVLGKMASSYPSGNLLRELLIHDVTGPTPCHLVRRSVFEQAGLFDESLPARQDWDMWIRIANVCRFGCVPEVLVEQGEHAGARVRTNPMNEIGGHQRIFEKYAHLRATQPLWVRLAARSAMYRRRGRVYFHRGMSVKKAIGLQLAAIAVWPLAFDSYAALGGMLLPGQLRRRVHEAWNALFGRTRLAIRSH